MTVDDVNVVMERAHKKFPEANIVKRPSTRPFAAYSAHDPDGNVFHFVSTCFECRPTGGTLTLGDETSGLAWFAPPAWPPDLMPVYRLRLEDALTRAAAPFVR